MLLHVSDEWFGAIAPSSRTWWTASGKPGVITSQHPPSHHFLKNPVFRDNHLIPCNEQHWSVCCPPSACCHPQQPAESLMRSDWPKHWFYCTVPPHPPPTPWIVLVKQNTAAEIRNGFGAYQQADGGSSFIWSNLLLRPHSSTYEVFSLESSLLYNTFLSMLEQCGLVVVKLSLVHVFGRVWSSKPIGTFVTCICSHCAQPTQIFYLIYRIISLSLW